MVVKIERCKNCHGNNLVQIYEYENSNIISIVYITYNTQTNTVTVETIENTDEYRKILINTKDTSRSNIRRIIQKVKDTMNFLREQ